MNSLSTDDSNPFGAGAKTSTDSNASLADKAFSKFANMETFDLVSKREAPRANPFESTLGNVGGNVPLADLKRTSVPKKDIMRSPVAAQTTSVPSGALVVASQQTGNWGAGVGGHDQYGQPAVAYSQQPSFGQQPPMYGQPSPVYGQQSQFSQSTPTNGQQPPIQQPQYYQQPPMQQPQYSQQQF